METELKEKLELAARQLTPTIGSCVTGLDLARIGKEEAARIRAELLRRKVLFFRNQDLDAESFLRLAQHFGTTTLHHPYAPAEANKVSGAASQASKESVWERDNSYRSDHWHTDVTFIDRPVSITFLRCIKGPEVGGDTIFANTVAAYERLAPPLRRLADELRAIHSLGPGLRERQRWNEASPFVTEHPFVRVHSETGERSLMLGSFFEQFVGLSREASVGLFRVFQDHIQKPENLVRWSWQAGDLAMWDNRSTQHYAVNDYGDAERLMQRLTVAGGVPVGVDGRPSVVISGDASSFSSIGPA